MPYIGRSGWNNLTLSRSSLDEIFEAIDASYAMVVSTAPEWKDAGRQAPLGAQSIPYLVCRRGRTR